MTESGTVPAAFSVSVQIPSPRLFFKRSPSARTSKGFLIVGTRVTARRSCSKDIVCCDDSSRDLTQHLGSQCDGKVQIPSPVWTVDQRGLDHARRQSPHFADGFVPVQELHDIHTGAQALLGQFARLNWPRPIDQLPRSVIDEPTAAAYYSYNLVRESQVRRQNWDAL
jgi:hypothetical protein